MTCRPFRICLFIMSLITMATQPLRGESPQKNLTIHQHLREALPGDLSFHDDTASLVTLTQLAKGKPLLIAPVYFSCPNLCEMTLDNLVTSLDGISLDAGRDFDVAVVSINPDETPRDAQRRKAALMMKYQGHPRQGWHFLTGDYANIQRMMNGLGFDYHYDETQKQYNHPSAIVIATPQGIISHYLYGLKFPRRDLRLALVEAANGKIGSPMDQFLLYCFHYEPSSGRYGVRIMNVMRMGGLAIMLIMAFGLVILRRQDSRKATSRSAAGAEAREASIAVPKGES